MRILVLTGLAPYPPNAGAKIRIANQMRYLSQKHEVVLMCPARPNTDEADNAHKLVGEYCIEARPILWQKRSKLKFVPHLLRYILGGEPIGNVVYFHEEVAAALYQATATEQFDVIDIHHGYFGPYINQIAPQSTAKTIFALHNVPYVQWKRMMLSEKNWRQKVILFRDWLFQKHATLKYARRYDKTIVVSETDRQILLRDAPDANVVAVTTGLSTDAVKLLPQPDTPFNLMYVGSMRYLPNIEAAELLGRHIFPQIKQQIPQAQLFIVGSAPPASVLRLHNEQDGITVTGYVDSVTPYYQQSWITLVPLLAGSGIRVKILESMALGRPVISTSLGCEGLQVTHNKDILIADDPADFAAQTIRLMRDTALWQQLADNGRRLVETVYDWQVTGRQLEQVFQTP